MKRGVRRPRWQRFWWLGALAIVYLVFGYFMWCPRFGHNGATDSEQIAAIAPTYVIPNSAFRLYIVHDHAVMMYGMQMHNSAIPEVLFAKRFCRWSVEAQSGSGFDMQMLRDHGVSGRDAAALYAMLMADYAEGPQ